MPDEPVHGLDGRQVLITFLDETNESNDANDFSTLEEVIERIRSSGHDIDDGQRLKLK